ncbi:retrovirus-related Pol polyprotein from type-1 retrotransposable element R2 [Clonorchis sinensis]|uniref:Retrovirus-related Pol polyprotein from type-1 retrotransposable element R2 n=1 Tax=Clonorchis sinensis TaxID=79923 RepID=G7Y8A8_CLOSI|nr:retrovirus-related Pol polyprotein from type-1 retrotransposable element R2 [Clonorchis sinensis]
MTYSLGDWRLKLGMKWSNGFVKNVFTVQIGSLQQIATGLMALNKSYELLRDAARYHPSVVTKGLLHSSSNICTTCALGNGVQISGQQLSGCTQCEFALADERWAGIMTPEQVLSLLDLHASRTSPHTWKTVLRRRRQLAHRMPVNRKQIRRANYAAIQTLHHQRRKDAASAVLDGSWKDLYKGNCGLPPDAEQYWKQVLSAPKHVDSRPSRVVVPSDWSLIEPITGEEVGHLPRRVNTKEELVAAWGDSLHNSVDGRGLRELVASPLSNRWLVFPERVFSRIFIRGIQLRCNLLRTRVRSARHGHGGQTILCRGNCGQPESLVHILQSCWITHDARCARHNRVARELAKRLRRLGYTVFEELRAPTSTSFIKPDLIAVRERRATVIDVSIVSDGRGVTVWNEKKQKYGADEFSLAIISALRAIGCDVDFLDHQPMIISYRGICFPQSAKAVIGLGLSKVTVSDLCLLAIVGSLRTYDTVMRGTWR